jgi:NADPH:quinone reductase-like Zn-dependent oxidoreductase
LVAKTRVGLLVPAGRLVKLPAALDLQKAAAIMVQGITTYRELRRGRERHG